MAVTLGTNINSLRAQRKLARATNEVEKTFARLSTGRRVNKASDDSAGLAVATSLATSSRLFGQAIRNVNDGISALSIAERATGELTNIVTRIKELAEQASSGSYSSTQRNALNTEAQQLANEFSRITASTSFNGIKLLDGSTTSIAIQAGSEANANNRINVTLVTGSTTSAGTSTTTNTGTGSFAAAITIGSTGGTFMGAVTDFNNDGFADIAISTYTSQVGIRLSNGNGTFKATLTASLSNDSDVSAADFNGDGVMDLIGITSGATSTIEVALGNGNGTFKARNALSVGPDAEHVTVADFNGDGFMDIASADSSDAKASIILGNGNGTFKARVTYDLPVPNWNFTSIANGDFNNDGYKDLYGSGFVLLGNGNGTFKSPLTLDTAVSMIGDKSPVIADINGDGNQDILAGGAGGGSDLRVTLGNGNGTFKATTGYGGGGLPAGVAVKDLNGDGLLDVVTSDTNSGDVNIFTNAGGGLFSYTATYTTAYGAAFVALADFNNDAVNDIYLVNRDTYAKDFIFLGNYTSVVTTTTATTASALSLSTFSLTTQSGAQSALTSMESMLSSLATQQGTFGSLLNRLSAAVANASAIRESYSTAANRIVDADMAHEVTYLLRQQIVQDSSSAILAQANQMPSIALQLLEK